MCAYTWREETLLISACTDNTLRLWNPVTGEHTRMPDPPGRVSTMCAVPMDDRTLLASPGGKGHIVHLWNPLTGRVVHTFTTRRTRRAFNVLQALDLPPWTTAFSGAGSVRELCAVPDSRGTLLASRGDGRSVRLWNPATGEHVEDLSHPSPLRTMCAYDTGDLTLLASACDDRIVRFWDTRAQSLELEIPVHQPVEGLAVLQGLLIVRLSKGLLALSVSPGSGSSRSAR
jgi:WD40 repeat protein